MKYSTILGLLITLGQYGVQYVWPAYASFQAIESKASLDDTQWLTYWLLFGLLQTAEGIFWPILQYVPLYQLGKLAVFAFLSLPQTNGASVLYHKARPFVLQSLQFMNDVAGKGREEQTPKGKELSGLRERISKVQGDIFTTLSSAYDQAAVDELDVSAVTETVSHIESVLEAEKHSIGKQRSSQGQVNSTTNVTAPDANIKVSVPQKDPFTQFDSVVS